MDALRIGKVSDLQLAIVNKYIVWLDILIEDFSRVDTYTRTIPQRAEPMCWESHLLHGLE